MICPTYTINFNMGLQCLMLNLLMEIVFADSLLKFLRYIHTYIQPCFKHDHFFYDKHIMFSGFSGQSTKVLGKSTSNFRAETVSQRQLSLYVYFHKQYKLSIHVIFLCFDKQSELEYGYDLNVITEIVQLALFASFPFFQFIFYSSQYLPN